MLIDTHCHIHESSYPLDKTEVLRRAAEAEVTKMICIGTDETSSKEAVQFVAEHENIFAAVGVHPHEAKEGWGEVARLVEVYAGGRGVALKQVDLRHVFSRSTSWSAAELTSFRQSSPSQDELLKKTGQSDNVSSSSPLPHKSESVNANGIVAVGEIGLDYYYSHSQRNIQIEALQAQIEVALRHNLPVIFHIREAFDDFWPIFDGFHGIRGVLHSFTDTQENLEEGLKRGLFIGVNGISTFTKDKAQQAMFQNIPLEKLLLETDAPYLTPAPFRGTVNEPAFVREVAQHQATIRDMPFSEIAAVSTANAEALFALR